MKKAFLLSCAIAVGSCAMAQTLPNSDMELWRTSAAGSGSSSVAVMAPDNWFGADSLIIADGQTYGTLLAIPPSVWQRQLFQEATIKHGGSYSAKLVTEKQDTLGVFPGIMSNAQAHVTINLSPLGVGPITYSGGTATNYHILTASAWVQYTQAGALDSGMMTVNAYSTVGGVDSVIGTGSVAIGPSTSFAQVTANIVYNGSGLPVDTVRVLFASSAGANSAIGSTLYVDDVTMTGEPNAVPVVTETGDVLNVYPNPATEVLHVDARQNAVYTCSLMSVSGQVVATQTFTGHSSIDMTRLANGFYFYTITNNAGAIAQTGKVNVAR